MRARRPAAAPRAPTPSGPPLVRLRTTASASTGPARRTSSAASGSATRTTGSATTRSSRRTAASACSRTSSATTSACPDEYDTSGNTGGAENSTGFWTPWSSGSYGSNGDPDDGIGDRPFPMSAWDKLQLGWLDYEVVNPGDKKKEIKLGPAEANTKQAAGSDRGAAGQAGRPATSATPVRRLEVLLLGRRQQPRQPDGAVGDAARRRGRASRRKVRYNIEIGCDYAYLEVNGTTGCRPDLSTTRPSCRTEGIDGVSSGWATLTANLSVVRRPDRDHRLRLLHGRRGAGASATSPAGISIDEIAITGQPTDGAETTAGWNYTTNGSTGFHVTTGSETFQYFNAYVAENRQYRRLRRGAPDRAVQLRRHGRSELGGAVPLPGRHARLVLGHSRSATTTSATTRAAG